MYRLATVHLANTSGPQRQDLAASPGRTVTARTGHIDVLLEGAATLMPATGSDRANDPERPRDPRPG